MKKLLVIFVLILVSSPVFASWYWPFGSDDDLEADEPRLSELMEPASMLIDEATDLAEDGKIDESIEKYRVALLELDRIESENVERVKKPEFATLRNKRAYVNAAIDAILMSQVRNNAKRVSVTDTTELEKKFQLEQEKKTNQKSKSEEEKKVVKEAKSESKATPAKPQKSAKEDKPLSPRDRAMKDIESGDFTAAELTVKSMLSAKADDPVALNLLAILEASRGNRNAAEEALDRVIMTSPRDYNAYYNMANLLLQREPADKMGAKRYYETGRSYGGPTDAALEGALK